MNEEVLAIYGSPRNSGFSSALHNMFLSPFIENKARVKIFNSYAANVLPCGACSFCKTNDSCIHDDMNELYQALTSCSLLTVSSPIYFSGISSSLKAIIDRCQFIWNHRQYVKPKRALFIAAAGSVYGNAFEGAIITMRHFFNTLNASFDEKDFIFLAGTDEMQQVPEDVVTQAENLGRKYISFYS